MFWLSIIISGFAFVFIKLGAYSVWTHILGGSLKFALVMILFLVIAVILKTTSNSGK